MTHDDYNRIICASAPSDWRILEAPPYFGRPADDPQSPSHVQVLKTDLAVWMLTGRRHEASFDEPWVKRCLPDGRGTGSSFYVDFFYGPAPVDVDILVAVDGRCCLPIPDLKTMEVSAEDAHVARIVHSKGQARPVVDFDEYMARAGIKVRPAL